MSPSRRASRASDSSTTPSARSSPSPRRNSGPAACSARSRTAGCTCTCRPVRRSTPRACSTGTRSTRSAGSSRWERDDTGRVTSLRAVGRPARRPGSLHGVGLGHADRRPPARVGPASTCGCGSPPASDLPTLVARVRSLFDLDADPEAVDAVSRPVPELAPAVARVPGDPAAGARRRGRGPVPHPHRPAGVGRRRHAPRRPGSSPRSAHRCRTTWCRAVGCSRRLQ